MPAEAIIVSSGPAASAAGSAAAVAAAVSRDLLENGGIVRRSTFEGNSQHEAGSMADTIAVCGEGCADFLCGDGAAVQAESMAIFLGGEAEMPKPRQDLLRHPDAGILDRIPRITDEVDHDLQQLVAIRYDDWQLPVLTDDFKLHEFGGLHEQRGFDQFMQMQRFAHTAAARQRLLCADDIVQVLQQLSRRLEFRENGARLGGQVRSERPQIIGEVAAALVIQQEGRELFTMKMPPIRWTIPSAASAALLEHLRNVLSAQQVRAHLGDVCEAIDLAELLDAVFAEQVPERLRIQAVRQYERLPRVMTDRHKLRMILVNLVDNARDAVLSGDVQSRKIVLRLRQEEKHAVITIEDSGLGIPSEVLPSLWRFGFTTKPNGQGFDLHNSANAARDIGATIDAQSDGANKGARFTVRLPIVTEHDGPGTATPIEGGWTAQ